MLRTISDSDISPLDITYTHAGFHPGYRIDGKPFHPCLADNVELIKVSEMPSQESKTLLLWEIDNARDLTYFNEALWPVFQHRSFGVILQRGPLSQDIEKGTLLAAELPDTLPAFIILEEDGSTDPASFFRLTSKERFPHFHLIIKSPMMRRFPNVLPALPGESQHVSLGLCLPSKEEGWQKLNSLLEEIEPPFRVIPEALLTTEWDGLDTLLVIPEGVSQEGRRKLLGFEAAGGEILLHLAEKRF